MVVVCVIALQAIGMGNSPLAGDPGYGFVSAEKHCNRTRYAIGTNSSAT